MRQLGLILLASLLAGCGTTRAANPAQDEADWQGTWKLVSCVANGESQTGNVQWIVDGDQYSIRVDGQSRHGTFSFKLDPSQKRIDVHHHDTPEGTYGGKLKGIYEIDGESMKVCYDLKGERYPTSFDAGRDSRQVVYQFQRERR